MFSRISRYNGLSDVMAVDARGRVLKSRSIRLLPDVWGKFLHSVEERDRLDHLGFKYYALTQKWWRICDGNSAFKSPLGLLSDEPVLTVRVPVTFSHADAAVSPPWYKVLKRLREMAGVENVRFVDEARLGKKVVTRSGGERVEVDTHLYDSGLFFEINKLDVTPRDICTAVEAVDSGFSAGTPVVVGRLGKPVVIPPVTVG